MQHVPSVLNVAFQLNPLIFFNGICIEQTWPDAALAQREKMYTC